MTGPWLNLTGRSGSLEAFLRKEIGIEEDAALAYLSDGRRLGTDNMSDLAEVHDQVSSLVSAAHYGFLIIP